MVKTQLPNGPRTHPWLQTLEWMKDPLGFMDKYTQQWFPGQSFAVLPTMQAISFISSQNSNLVKKEC